MKNDKLVLIMAILTIIGFSFAMAFLTNKKPKEEKKEEIPTPVEEVKGTRNCTLPIYTGNDNVVSTNRLTINYTNDIVKNYSVEYSINYNGNRKAKSIYDEYVARYDDIVNYYQTLENYSISNYYNENNEYTVVITHDLNSPSESNLLIPYNTNINDAIEIVGENGFACE